MSVHQQEQHQWRSSPLFIVLTIATGQFSDQFLFGMRVPLLPVLIHDHLHISDPSEAQHLVANILAAFSIATLVCAIPAGWLADFRALRGYLYLAGLGALFWSMITFYTSERLAMMVMSRALNGLSAAILYAAGYAIVSDSVGGEDLGKALGTIRSLVAVAEISGPPLGGIIFSRWGFEGILHVSLGILSIDLVMRLLMVEKKLPAGAQGTSPLPLSREFLDGSHRQQPKTCIPFHVPLIITYLADAQILVCLFLSMTQYIIIGCYDSTLALELESPLTNGFDLPPSSVGFVYLFLAVPTLVFAPLAGWAVDRFGPKKVAIWGYVCFVPALAGMVYPASRSALFMFDQSVILGFFCLGLFMQGLCLALVSTPGMVKAKMRVGELRRRRNNGATSEDESDSVMGQMFGLNTMVFSFGLMVGDYAGADLRAFLGYGGKDLVLAGLCAVAAILVWVFFNDEDRDVNSLPDGRPL